MKAKGDRINNELYILQEIKNSKLESIDINDFETLYGIENLPKSLTKLRLNKVKNPGGNIPQTVINLQISGLDDKKFDLPNSVKYFTLEDSRKIGMKGYPPDLRYLALIRVKEIGFPSLSTAIELHTLRIEISDFNNRIEKVNELRTLYIKSLQFNQSVYNASSVLRKLNIESPVFNIGFSDLSPFIRNLTIKSDVFDKPFWVYPMIDPL